MSSDFLAEVSYLWMRESLQLLPARFFQVWY